MKKDGTTIEWVVALARAQGKRADVWNPQEGCSRAGPGCDNCWAAREVHMRGRQKGAKIAARFGGLTTVTKDGAIAFNGTVRAIESELEKPLREKTPTVYFVCSRSDLFHPKVAGDFRREVRFVALAPSQHTYIFLTKRPAAMQRYFPGPCVVPNFLLGTTVCNQAEADAARPIMAALASRGWRTWVSYEPALGPVDWTGWEFLKQIVFGGESGNGTNIRPPHPAWARVTRDFCAANAIAYFHKQWGGWIDADEWLRTIEAGPGFIMVDGRSWRPARPLSFEDAAALARLTGRQFDHFSDGLTMIRVGKKAAGAMLDGREHREVPT